MRPLWPRCTAWAISGAETPSPSDTPATAVVTASAKPPSRLAIRVRAICLASEGAVGAELAEEPVRHLAVEERERAMPDPGGASGEDDGLDLVGGDLQREVRQRVDVL